MFTLIKTKENNFRVYDIYLYNTEKDEYYSISFELVDFIKQLFSKRIFFFLRSPEPTRYLSIEFMKQSCFRCGQQIDSVGRVFYHEYAYGKLVKQPKDGFTIREVPKKDINLINSYFQPKYFFAPLVERYSKTVEHSYMANSCPNCDVIMGKFFEEHEYDNYEHFETESVATTHTHDYGNIGQWFFDVNPLNPIEYENDGNLEIFDPATGRREHLSLANQKFIPIESYSNIIAQRTTNTATSTTHEFETKNGLVAGITFYNNLTDKQMINKLLDGFR